MTELGKFFEVRERSDGTKFHAVKEDAPEWITLAVREAHQSDLPRDWIYEECHAAVDAIDEETLKDEDDVFSYADSRIEIYTQALYQWAADMCLTHSFAAADEEASELYLGGKLPDGPVSGAEACLRSIQFCVIASIARTMLQASRAHKLLPEPEDA